MELVIAFLVIMVITVLVQLSALIYCMKHDDVVTVYGEYTDNVKEKTKAVINALISKIIKKHLLTNSAEEYDSKDILRQYKGFLNSNLMKDLTQMYEEQYHG